MKNLFSIVIVLVILAAAAWGYVRFLGGEIPFLSAVLAPHEEKAEPGDKDANEGGEKKDEDEKPKDVVATVKVAQVRKGVITDNRILYGSVVPGKGSLATVSAPFECKVLRILVRKGQEVAQGDEVIEIGPSEDSRLSLEQAQNKSDMAKQELERVKQRLALKLATNQELIQATQASRDADLQARSLSRKGISKPVTVHAESAGVINSIAVQEGALVTQGAALLEVATLAKLEVQLGAEPDLVSHIGEGQTISVSSLDKASTGKIACPVRGTARTVNSATHLVDIFVTLPADSGMMLGEPVQGELRLNSQETLIIPRTAVLPQDQSYVVFVLRDGHAHKVVVDRGMENSQDAEIRGGEIHDGDTLAILGNYELEDGMAVTTTGGAS